MASLKYCLFRNYNNEKWNIDPLWITDQLPPHC